MADEDVTLETEDSTQDTQDDVNWQKRFTDTQAEYTRSQQALKDAESVWEDEQALLARIAEKHPHLLMDEEPEDAEEDDFDSSDEPDVMTKAEFKAWQDEQNQKAALEKNQQQFEMDLNRFVGDRELDDKGSAWVRSQSFKGPDELEAAVNEWFEYTAPLSKRRRKPTAAIPGGKAATGVPDYDDMSHDQAVAAMVDRARSLDTQT